MNAAALTFLPQMKYARFNPYPFDRSTIKE